MSDENKIILKVSAAQAILKKPKEKEANLQQTWKSFLMNDLKLKRKQIDGLIVCSLDFTPTKPRKNVGWWAPLEKSIGDSISGFRRTSKKNHTVKLVSRESLSVVKTTSGNAGNQKKQPPRQINTGNPSIQIAGTSSLQSLRKGHFRSARKIVSKTLPPPLFPLFDENAVSDTGDLQQNQNTDNPSGGANQILEDDNMSQCTQGEELLADLERQGIINEIIKLDVERITAGYRNDTMLQIKKEMLDFKAVNIERWRRINTNYLPKTFSFLKEAFGV